MATIYRFIVESKGGSGSGGRRDGAGRPSKKTTAKGKWVSVLGGEKGGVEHNRKMRAINPLLNRATGGWWEKGMRVGRAGMGLIQRNTETGKLRINVLGPAMMIIIAFVINTILKIQNFQRQVASRQNTQNYKAMENGFSAVHGEYKVARDYWSGRTTFNENK